MKSSRTPKKPSPVAGREESIDYKNLELLAKCLSSQGQIVSRRRTGLNSQRQRELKNAMKRARHMALLPFVA